MSEPLIIHQRRGTTSKPLDITGWELGEWQENGDQPKRLIVDPGGNRWIDYLGKDGKHDLIKWDKTPEAKEKKKLEKYVEPNEPSAEKILYDFVEELGIEFCCDQFANNCCVYNNRYYEITSREIKAEIARNYFEQKDSVFSEAVWLKFLNIITNKCILNKKYFPLRCHTEGSAIYYDTGVSVWKFEKDTATHYTIEACSIVFRRYNHQIRAPLHQTERSAKEIIQEICSMFNIQDHRPETIPLRFDSKHQEPITMISGDPGSAKSTFSMFIKMLVDPDQVDKLTLPDKKGIVEFGMHRQHFYLLLYDNVRNFYQEQSDELCRMVTGGTSVSRRLYTNGELYISKGLPRMIINGLRPEPSSFNDLLDRTLLFDMNRIHSSIPELAVWKKLDSLIPSLRYACLRDMSNALLMAYDLEFDNLPRMSEYCLLGESLNLLWGGELGSFVNWFKKKMDLAHASGMDDPLTIILLEYLKMMSPVMKEGICMTASEWRFSLEKFCTEKTPDFAYVRPNMHTLYEEKDFPKNAVWLGRRFRDISPLLHTLGFSIRVLRTPEENRIEIKSL